MTYLARRRNLHGIMYLPYNRGATHSKKNRFSASSAGNLPAGNRT
jgi:hypothetical protein